MRAIRCLAALVLALAALAACAPTPAPTTAPTITPAAVQSPTVAPTTAPTVEITVYFTDLNRFNTGTMPFEVGVPRTVSATANLPEAALAEFFKGPTAAERAQGLERINSGFTGFSALKLQGGTAHVYLNGPCASHGATYCVAQPVMKNLLQFKEIEYVKIYDADGTTTDPTGPTNSIPPCLEP